MATAIGLGIGIPFQRKRGGAAPFVGLLDEVPGAVFAASMRLLRNGYSGGLLRVIAYDGASEQGAADIMPYKIDDEYWIDLNSTLENLDATATGRGLTTSDTLADLCSSGVNNYDGLVTTWYGQNNGTPLNATQNNISAMPKLVDTGGLVTENGKPALDFDGVDDYLDESTFVTTSYDFSVFSVFKTISTSLEQNLYQIYRDQVSGSDEAIASGIAFKGSNRIGSRSSNNSSTIVGSGEDFVSTNQSLFTQIANVDTPTNNTYLDNNATTKLYECRLLVNKSDSNSITIGSWGEGSNYFLSGKLTEMIIYPSDQSSNRTSIESNINNAFSIY